MLFYCVYCEKTTEHAHKEGMPNHTMVCAHYSGNEAVTKHSVYIMREFAIFRIVYSDIMGPVCATRNCELCLYTYGLFCDTCGVIYRREMVKSPKMLRTFSTIDRLLAGMEYCFEYETRFSTAIWEDSFGEPLKALFQRNKLRNLTILSCDSILPAVILGIIVEYTHVYRSPPLHW